MELRSLLADPRSDARKVADVVKQDPGITAKVMLLANSSFFFRGSAVADVHGAVTRLGASLISRLVLVEGLLAASPAAAHFGFDRDARQFYRAALLAEASVSPGCRDEAALATLLCPIGRVVMIAAAPERVEQAMTLSAAGIPIATAEREVFGTSHAAVGGHLLSLCRPPSAPPWLPNIPPRGTWWAERSRPPPRWPIATSVVWSSIPGSCPPLTSPRWSPPGIDTRPGSKYDQRARTRAVCR